VFFHIFFVYLLSARRVKYEQQIQREREEWNGNFIEKRTQAKAKKKTTRETSKPEKTPPKSRIFSITVASLYTHIMVNVSLL